MSKHEKESKVLVMEKPTLKKQLHPHIDLPSEKDDIEKYINIIPPTKLDIRMAKDNYQQQGYKPTNGMTVDERKLYAEIESTAKEIDTLTSDINLAMNNFNISFKKHRREFEKSRKRIAKLEAAFYS